MNIDAVIFDFDDTLVVTNAVYDQIRQLLFAKLRELHCQGEEQWADFLNQQDIANIRKAGRLCKTCFPQALRQTYEHFARLSGLEINPRISQHMEDYGWSFYDDQPQLIEGAVELLTALQGRARLFLLTQGDADVQLPRLRRSGLLPFFTAYRIAEVKDAQVFEQLLAEQQIDRTRSWMVGNSIRSDINPALHVGLQAAHFTRSAWAYDMVEPIGEYHEIQHLKDFLELIDYEF